MSLTLYHLRTHVYRFQEPQMGQSEKEKGQNSEAPYIRWAVSI